MKWEKKTAANVPGFMGSCDWYDHQQMGCIGQSKTSDMVLSCSVKPFLSGYVAHLKTTISWHIGVPTFMLHLFSWATHLLFEMWTTSQDTHPPSHTITRSQWRTHLRTFVFWPPPMFGPTKTKLRRESPTGLHPAASIPLKFCKLSGKNMEKRLGFEYPTIFSDPNQELKGLFMAFSRLGWLMIKASSSRC